MAFAAALLFCILSFRVAHSQNSSFAEQCSTHYPRLTRSELVAGELPYLFGRKAVDCEACESDRIYKKFCSFKFNNDMSDHYYAEQTMSGEHLSPSTIVTSRTVAL